MPRCYPNIYRCIQCLPWHSQSVLILWHFDCSLDFFNFSWRGTKIHPKNLHFWDQLKASFSSNICPNCISCHLEFQNFQGGHPLSDSPVPCPVSAYFQKFSIYLKTFWESCIVFGLTGSGLEPTIYRTWDKHANHNTTDTFLIWHVQ